MSKLHEILAVESNLAGQATKALGDLTTTFTNKGQLFESKLLTFQSNEEGRPPVTEEQLDIQTTVEHELDWVSGIVAKAMDSSVQIDVANTQAKADVVLEDGTILLKNIPATALLALEKSLKEVQNLARAIPTLDPAKAFRPDEQKGKGIYQARVVTGVRTKKDKEVLTLAPATDKHPAQVQLIDKDVPVGTLTKQEWSAKYTPAQKAEVLDRCDMLIRAIRKARARANEFEADTNIKVGKTLLNYLFA